MCDDLLLVGTGINVICHFRSLCLWVANKTDLLEHFQRVCQLDCQCRLFYNCCYFLFLLLNLYQNILNNFRAGLFYYCLHFAIFRFNLLKLKNVSNEWIN